MIELFAYKLFNNYISEFIPEIKWLDIFNDQYNKDGEDRPFRDTSCFIEFQPRFDIINSRKIRSDGQLLVNFHLTFPRSANYTNKKKNVNETLNLFSTANTFNKYINVLDSSHYPSNSVYQDKLLIEATNVYAMNTAELKQVQNIYTEKYQVQILTYQFEYVDASAYTDVDTLSGWTYDVEYGVNDVIGSLSDDFGTSYDVRTDINYIWFEKIQISGNTLTVTGHSYYEGVPMDVEYGVSDNDYHLPTYTTSNVFTGLSPGEYWVYMRDQRDIGAVFPTNPITIV